METEPQIKPRRTPRDMADLRELLHAHLKAGGTPVEFAKNNRMTEGSGQLYKATRQLGWQPMFLSAAERKLILANRTSKSAGRATGN